MHILNFQCLCKLIHSIWQQPAAQSQCVLGTWQGLHQPAQSKSWRVCYHRPPIRCSPDKDVSQVGAAGKFSRQCPRQTVCQGGEQSKGNMCILKRCYLHTWQHENKKKKRLEKILDQVQPFVGLCFIPEERLWPLLGTRTLRSMCFSLGVKYILFS